MSKWLYIAGRGHSGSTMLDIILGNSEYIESVGEFVSGMGRYNALCSCGKTFKDCFFWSNVRYQFEKEMNMPWEVAVSSIKGQAHISKLLTVLFSHSDSLWVKNLVGYSNSIASAITSDNSGFVLDSSKEITRALFLLKFLPETKVIHLVKNPVNILESYYYRWQKGLPYPFLRKKFYPQKHEYIFFMLLVCINWLIGNFLLDIAKIFFSRKILMVKYEDILDRPEEIMDDLGGFVGYPLEAIKSKLLVNEPFQTGHNIGGNSMRMNKEVVIDPKRSRRKGLPAMYRLLAYIVCWPLLLKYRYM